LKVEINKDIYLRPRFKLNYDLNHQEIISKFKNKFSSEKCTYYHKISDGHIIIDLPKDENHFWSPQLNIEIIEVSENKSLVKGLFGPKPQIWTMFMFIHFVLAFAFIGFSIAAYVKWSLKTDYTFFLGMIFFPIIAWFAMYFLGRLGKKKGQNQMQELYGFLIKTLES
jgi:hypothetical protein